MDPEDNMDEDEPLFPWLPPDDRLWRHPSELAGGRSPASPGSSASPGSPASDPIGSPSEAMSEAMGEAMAGAGRHRSAAAAGASHGPRHRVGAAALARTGTAVAWRDVDRRLWTVAILAGVVGALVASSTGVMVGQFQHSTTVVHPVEIVTPADSFVTIATTPRSDNIGDIAAGLRPAIVELLVNSNGLAVTGSGVIFRSDGYVLTDDHIVEGAQTMVAVLSDGQRIKCRLIGADQTTDIAVVKLQSNKTQAVATLGSSSHLRVGQMAIALGSPFGLAGGVSVTSGIISAVDSQVSPVQGPSLNDMIQTDAVIDPGSSGGALVDSNGMVVGITTSVTVGDQGMQTLGFATPIEVAQDVANQLLTTGRVVHAWLGVEGSDIDVDTARSLGISGGALVQDVDGGSPAARAGLVATDVVTSFAGQPVDSMNDLDTAVRQHLPGDDVSISYLRNGQPRTTQLVLLDLPDSDFP